MFPRTLDFGPFHLHPYGLLLAAAFLAALFLSGPRIRRRAGVGQAVVLDLFQIILLSSIVGARIFFVAFHWDLYRAAPLHALAIWEGGMTLYGGLLLPIPAVWIMLRRRRISFLDVADCVAPSLALGIAIGRIGCFLRGCCYGLPTDSPLGLRFPEGGEASLQGRRILLERGVAYADLPASPALHPTQLYSSFGGLLIFLLVLWIERRVRYRGAMFGAFLLLYGAHRMIMDLFRYYDPASSGAWGLTVSQWVSVGFLAAGLLVWTRLLRLREDVA